MKISIDDKLKDYKWLVNDCINIITEIKQKEPLNINFTLQDAGFGNKLGRLIMKEGSKIVVIKDYPYIDINSTQLHLHYENNHISIK